MKYTLDMTEVARASRPPGSPATVTVNPKTVIFASGVELASHLRRAGIPGSFCGPLDICQVPSPGGPVPIPYPVAGGTKKLEAELHSSGYPNARLSNSETTKVKIEGKTVATHDKSVFKKSIGDEAGTS